MKQVCLLLAALLLLAYVSDSPAAATALRGLTQKRSKEQRQQERDARRQQQQDQLMLTRNPTSGTVKIYADYNMATNAFTRAKGSAVLNYCIAYGGATQCDPMMSCTGGFVSQGSVSGSDICLPYPQYYYPPCGLRLRGKKADKLYTPDAIRAGGYSVNIDLITSDIRSCVLRRRSARKLAQTTDPNVTTTEPPPTIMPVLLTTGQLPPKPLVQPTDPPQDPNQSPDPTIMPIYMPIIATGDPMEKPTEPVAMEGPPVVINTGFVKPDLPPGDSQPPGDGTVDPRISETGEIVKPPPILYTMAPGPNNPDAGDGQIVPPPGDLIAYITSDGTDDGTDDGTGDGGPIYMPMEPPILMTDRPNDPQPNWRGDSAGSGSGKNVVVYEGGDCEVYISMSTPGVPSLQCHCFKGKTYAKINPRAQRTFASTGEAAFNRWKCKDLVRMTSEQGCMPYSCGF